MISIAALGLQASGSVARDNVNCGNLIEDAAGYGPFDYTDPAHNTVDLTRVEKHHFTSDVRLLIRGSTNELPHRDLDYTLRKFPNHHLALDSMARLQRDDGGKLKADIYTTDCYFKRATRFSPSDDIVWLIWGIHLHKSGQFSEAEEKYKTAIRVNPENSQSYYNLGLLYVDMGQKEKAQAAADDAYRLRYPQQGLKRRIARMK
ncbi:MAG: tetratricopeptide repeat protein [Pseudomonadales bacterium]|uniref:TPR repeat protein n=2 Tax=Oleiphilus messinensis TaxID=141451 RepID=A0A1Y0I7L0_9GAMM|nr:TPR repeat protein [Oleiphilus messinensis]MCG8609310.1 tetratricopeptide repeat protein [Pseudomonadales bacterium]